MTTARQIITLKEYEEIAENCELMAAATQSDFHEETETFFFEDGSRIEQDGIIREFRAYDAKTDSNPASTAVAKFEY